MSAVEEYRAALEYAASRDVCLTSGAVEILADAALTELEAHAEHDEDNLEGLQHALVRANQQYTQAEAALVDKQKEVVAALQTAVDMEAERDALRQGYEILATKLSEANAELVRLETQPRSG